MITLGQDFLWQVGLLKVVGSTCLIHRTHVVQWVTSSSGPTGDELPTEYDSVPRSGTGQRGVGGAYPSQHRAHVRYLLPGLHWPGFSAFLLYSHFLDNLVK